MRAGVKGLAIRRATAFVASVAAVLIAAPAADAHVRSSLSAVDFRVGVFPLQGAARGVLTARVYDSDLALALTVADRNVVLVLGYLGEPAIRVDHTGVAVNETSPTAAGMGLRCCSTASSFPRCRQRLREPSWC